METNIKGKILLLILLTVLCLLMKMTNVLGGDFGKIHSDLGSSGLHVKLELPIR